MKLELKNGCIIAHAETTEDSVKLLRLAEKPPVESVVPRKKHKRHVFMKTCKDCGKECKGNLGLGIHQASHRKEQEKITSLIGDVGSRYQNIRVVNNTN